MLGHDKHDDELEEFIAARTQDLHHDAYQLTAAQQPAEELVIAVLADMRREHIELAQAGSTARLRMARAAARDNTTTHDSDVSQLAAQFRPLARLSPRQRATLVLQVVDGYDDRETARHLQLTARATTEALQSVPYDELPGTTPHSGELRSLLESFGDLATAPSATTTLADVRAVPPPPRRPWWTYAAAFLVIALTVATVVVTQHWHDDWLQTPNGLNQAHGTHFPAYTQGYKLVAIHDVAPGPADTLDLRARDAVVIDCAKHQADETTIARVPSGISGIFMLSCSPVAGRQHLTPVTGDTVLAIDDFSRAAWPVAVYRRIPLSEYPIATRNFDVQHSLTLDSARSLTSGKGRTLQPVAKSTVLTIRGSADRPNGTFTGTLELPAGSAGTTVNVVALLSPTTTGRYRVRVNHDSPWTTCGGTLTTNYEQSQLSAGCFLLDHHVPQVTFDQTGTSPSAGRMPVDITVTDARDAWTLQVVADSYKLDASAVDDGANG